MKKSLFFFLVISLNLSCGGPDDGPAMEPEPVNPIGMDDDDATGVDQEPDFSLDLTELNGLDLTSIEAQGLNGIATIGTDGSLDKSLYEEQLKLPILFNKNNEVLFGYYPSLANEGEINSSEILKFFVVNYPSIALMDKSLEEITSLLAINENRIQLESYVNVALNNNVSPFDDDAFLNLLAETANNISNEISGKNENVLNTKRQESTFQFQYGRQGKITIPSNAPIFSSVGFQVKNLIGDKTIFGPKILKSQTVPFSSSSIASFVSSNLENIFNESIAGNDIELDEDGVYTITFTNQMEGFGELSTIVENANREYFISYLLGAFGTVFNSFLNDSCTSEVSKLILEIESTYLEFAILKNRELTKEERDGLYLKLVDSLSQIAVKCYGANSTQAQYFSKFLQFVGKLNIISNTAEFLFFARDAVLLKFSGSEIKEFDNDVLYDDLRRVIVSETTFTGKKDEKFLFSANLEEKTTKYSVDREFLKFEKIEEFLPAAEIPISVELTEGIQPGSGFVTNDNGPFKTNGAGGLFLEFNMGSEDSTFEIRPEINLTQAQFEPMMVQLKVEEENNEVDLIGRWNFSPNSVNGTQINYNNDGSINSTFDNATSGFLNSITFFSDGTADVGFNDFYDVTFSQSESSIIITALHDSGNTYDLIIFTGAWNSETESYSGIGSREFKQWFGEDRSVLSNETNGNVNTVLSRF